MFKLTHYRLTIRRQWPNSGIPSYYLTTPKLRLIIQGGGGRRRIAGHGHKKVSHLSHLFQNSQSHLLNCPAGWTVLRHVARSCFVTPRLLLRETGKNRGLKRRVRATYSILR